MPDHDLRRIARLLSPNQICAELLALCVVESTFTPELHATLHIDRSGGSISDNGRGIRMTPDRGDTLSHAERALTSIYPCLPGNAEVEAALRALVWFDRGSLGPALANAACPEFRFTSHRDGEVWSQSFRHGTPNEAPARIGSTEMTGTEITFTTPGQIDASALAAFVSDLTSRVAGFSVRLLISR